MAKTFKVGDEVRILDVSKIFIPYGEFAVDNALKNRKTFEVEFVDDTEAQYE